MFHHPVKGSIKEKIGRAKIKNHLGLFVNCKVDDAKFDSQMKDCLTTPAADLAVP